MDSPEDSRMTKIEIEGAKPAVTVDALDVVEFYGKMLSVALDALTDQAAIEEIRRINEDEAPNDIFRIREKDGRAAILLRLPVKAPAKKA